MLRKLIDIQRNLARLAEDGVGSADDLRKLEHITTLALEGKLKLAHTEAKALEQEMQQRASIKA